MYNIFLFSDTTNPKIQFCPQDKEIEYPRDIPDDKAVANDSSTLPTVITYKDETSGKSLKGMAH